MFYSIRRNRQAKLHTDMTVGNPFVLIGTFSFSLVTGNLFQQLYTFVDTIIIGKKIGALGIAAVGGTEWSRHLPLAWQRRRMFHKIMEPIKSSGLNRGSGQVSSWAQRLL